MGSSSDLKAAGTPVAPPTSASAIPKRNRLLQLLRWLIFFAVSSGIAHRIWIEKEKIASYPLALHPGWILLSMVCYFAGMTGCAFFWWLALRDLGGAPSFLNTGYAYFAGHLGKYVPGKGLVIIIRAALVRGPGVRAADAAFTSVLETFFLMSVGALVCLPVFVWAPLPHRSVLLCVSLVFALTFGAVVVPPVASNARSWLARIFPAIESGKSCRWKTLGRGLLLMLSTWGFCGLSLLLVFQSMSGLSLLYARMGFLRLWAIMTASVAFATIAGFVSLTPGGLGTREWILIETLGPFIGTPQVMLAAGIVRLQWIFTELLAGSVLWYFDRQWTHHRKRSN